VPTPSGGDPGGEPAQSAARPWLFPGREEDLAEGLERRRALFAALSRRLPADSGPYAYARAAFGNRLGFANAWSYWITAWAGNAAIAVGWVLYI
jgi:hypothetical protein